MNNKWTIVDDYSSDQHFYILICNLLRLLKNQPIKSLLICIWGFNTNKTELLTGLQPWSPTCFSAKDSGVTKHSASLGCFFDQGQTSSTKSNEIQMLIIQGSAGNPVCVEDSWLVQVKCVFASVFCVEQKTMFLAASKRMAFSYNHYELLHLKTPKGSRA